MNIFVTGGTGFIGTPLVKSLKKDGHKILLSKRLENIKDWKNELVDFNPDVFYHLAWEDIPNYSLDKCLDNLNYSYNLFKVIRETDCNKIISTGTCWENRKTNEPFVCTKRLIREIGDLMFRDRIFIWARLFYVYGKGSRKEKIIQYVIDSYKNGLNPEINKPNDTNDYVYIDDVINFLSKAIHIEKSSSYDIGYGECTKNSEIVAYVYDILKETGWKPTNNIKDGIRKYVGDLDE